LPITFHLGDVSENILVQIAQCIRTNIRELEGALISIIAQASLNKKEITEEQTKEITASQDKTTEAVNQMRRNLPRLIFTDVGL
jgi:chromosomal replication initiation ATPase DnaA